MTEDITKMISTASKTKLITLAISDTLGNHTLNPAERRALQKRAEKDGWAEELERAVFKAPHVNEVALGASMYINRAGYHLSHVLARVSAMSTLLRVLQRLDITNKEEIEGLIVAVMPEYLTEEEEETLSPRKHNSIKETVAYKPLEWGISNLYLVNNSKIGSYRLHPQALLDDLAQEFFMFLKTTIEGLIYSYKYQYSQLEILKETKPEIFKEVVRVTGYTLEYIEKQLEELLSVIPTGLKKEIDELNNEKFSDEVNEKYKQVLRKRILNNDYLASFITEEARKELDQSIEKLKSHVLYGR